MRFGFLACCLLVVGCAGTAGSPGSSNMPLAARSSQQLLKLTIHWPQHTASAAHERRSEYLSASTQSLAIAVNAGTPQYFNAPTSGASAVSEATVFAPVGNETFAIDSYDGVNGTGNHLGGSTTLQAVTANASNALSITLDAVVAAITVTPIGTQLLTGNQSTGYSLLGGTTVKTFSLSAYDADGNLIVGPGAPSLTLSGADANYAIAPVPGQSGRFTVTPATSPAAAAQLTLRAMESGQSVFVTHVTMTAAPTLYAFAFGGSVKVYDEQGNVAVSSGLFAGMIAPTRICYDPHNSEIYILDAQNYVTPTSYQFFAFSPDGLPIALSGSFPGLQYPGGTAYGGSAQIVTSGFDGPSWQVFTYDEQGGAVGAPYGDATTTPQVNAIFVDTAHANRRYVLNQDGGGATYYGTTAFNSDGTQYILAGNFPGISDASDLVGEVGNDTMLIPDIATGVVHTYTSEGLPKALSGTFPGVNAGNYPQGITYDPISQRVFIGTAAGILAFDANGNAVATGGAFGGSAQSYSLTVVP